MFKKSFVAIYFSYSQILIVLISSNKKKVKKYAEIELPAGIIENYVVKDEEALGKLIKGAWNKFGIKEKSVGIILPEFSTMAKSFKLPKLKITEVNEAVRWQAQEFLPNNINETVLDWKIVKKDTNSLEVSVVSVDKIVLMGYVTSVVNGGLFPLVVETPSLSLVRLCGNENEGTLIVYKDLSEALLILVQNGKVIGSGVCQESEGEIVKTVSRMISHYKDVVVKNLYFGGSGITEILIQKLEILKLKIDRLNVKVGGLNEGQIQKYLIPISMEMADPSEPSDPNSINLLPSDLVRKYKRENLKLKVWGLSLTITLFVWICFLVTLGSFFFITGQINNLETQSNSDDLDTQKRKEAIQSVKDINSITNRLSLIKAITVSPQTVLNEIAGAVPPGITINSYKIDLEKKEIFLSGISINRLSLIEFKGNLEKNSKISGVSIPISNFEEEVNIDFNLTFTYGAVSPIPTVSVKVNN